MLRYLVRVFLGLGVFAVGAMAVIGAAGALSLFDPDVLGPDRMRAELAALINNVRLATGVIAEAAGPSQTAYLTAMLVAGILIVSASIWFLLSFLRVAPVHAGPGHVRDPLFENKLAALLLIAALVVLAPPLFVRKLMENRETKIEIETPLAAAPDLAPLADRIAAADPARGERRAALCKACHTFEPGGEHLVGPNLAGVVGRDIAGLSDYAYSEAMMSVEGDWDYEALDAFLADTQAFAPGNMMYQRLSKPDVRAEMIRWMEEQK